MMKYILRAILDRVLQEAQKVGRLSKHLDIAKAYDILFPEFDSEHNQELGSAIAWLMQGLSTARAQGWVSDETSMQMLFQFCGMEIDIKEERARIQRDQARRETQNLNKQANTSVQKQPPVREKRQGPGNGGM